jgi:hypothetical protein
MVPSTKRIDELSVGDRLDLQGDRYATSDCWEFEYAEVYAMETETPTCVRIDFTNGDSVGFPPDHLVEVA